MKKEKENNFIHQHTCTLDSIHPIFWHKYIDPVLLQCESNVYNKPQLE